MTDSPSDTLASKHGIDRFKAALAELPRWQKGLLILSLLCVALGIGLFLVESPTPAQNLTQLDPASQDPNELGQNNLLPGQPGVSTQQTGGEEIVVDESWSPVFLKLGFGFFVGFSMGFALRVFLSMALAFCGFFCIGLFVLGQAELVTVEWAAMGILFDEFAAKAGEQFASLHAFLSGALPSAGLGTFGLYAGLKRR